MTIQRDIYLKRVKESAIDSTLVAAVAKTAKKKTISEAWTADMIKRNADIGSDKGYGITLSPNKNPNKHSHMSITRSSGGKIKVQFDDFGKKPTPIFVGTPEEVANHVNKVLGLSESYESSGVAKNRDSKTKVPTTSVKGAKTRTEEDELELDEMSAKDHYAKMKSKGRVTPIDSTRHPKRKGLEGPFRNKRGMVYYYDPKEGKYYDASRDMYLDVSDIEEGKRQVKESSDKDRFKKVFQAAMKKFGINDPGDLKSDAEKKKFFNYVDSQYTAKNESTRKVNEAKKGGPLNDLYNKVLDKGKKLGDWNMQSYFEWEGRIYMLQRGQAFPKGSVDDFKKKAQPGLLKALKLSERTLTEPEKKEKERIVKGMKKVQGDFEDRYGKDKGKSVMYATATKLAKESVNEQFKVGDKVHLGFGSKGGAGFNGTITNISGDTVHIKNEKGDTYKGPMKFISKAD